MASQPPSTTTRDSDMPYVQGINRRIQSMPTVEVEMVEWIDKSVTIAAAGVPQTLFESVDETVSKRYVFHVGPDGGGSIWLNWLGGEAVANNPGCVEMMPGDIFPVPTRAQVRVVATTANTPITAMEG